MLIHLFGSTNPSGEAFIRNVEKEFKDIKLIKYSRNIKSYNYLDFKNYKSFKPKGGDEPCLWINFGPIWLFAEFLNNLYENKKELTQNIKGILTCSSSSILTKRFANNDFDKQLVKKLQNSERQICLISKNLGIKLTVIRPTMIYGQVGNYKDQNISKLIQIMRILPIIALPQRTGFRQPIHANQLANIFINYVINFDKELNSNIKIELVEVGGNSIISYEKMLTLIQDKLPNYDKGKNCFFLKIPNRIFYLLAAPSLIFSPKLYESIMRISADLSGFKKSSSYEFDNSKEDFPVLPLSN